MLDDMIVLRDEIIQGDYRALYLAWLKAAEKAMHYDDIDEKTLEPIVPAGLKNLSSAQEKLIEFIKLDKKLIKVAAATSAPIEKETPQIEKYLSHLSQNEKDDYLKRLCRNEPALSTLLNKHLQKLSKASEITKIRQKKFNRRRFYELYKILHGGNHHVS